MHLLFWGNAFLEIHTSSGKRIICDPWILDGCYYGSWQHYPPVTLPKNFFEKIDYIYFSHLHPDHFDPRSLVKFDRETQVILSKRNNPTLEKSVRTLGFKNVTSFAVDAEHDLGDFRLRLWNDFRGEDVARHDEIGFELDSSILIIDGEETLFNATDNILELKQAQRIKEEYPNLTCALLPYAGAGPYPQLFENLSHEQKIVAREQVQRRYLNNFLEVAACLRPRFTIPVAGEYVIVGKNHRHTRYVHTPTPTELQANWNDKQIESQLVMLASGDELDLPSGQVRRSGLVNTSYSHEDRVRFAEGKAAVQYTIDEFRIPSELHLPSAKVLGLLNKARATLLEHQRRFNSFPQVYFVLEIENLETYITDLGASDVFKVLDGAPPQPYFKAVLPYEYVIALLTQHVHWNNLEIGNHVRLFRDPDIYQPDTHLILSFLHF